MDAELETIIDQAQKLPAAQRLQLIAALSERMARGAGIEEADRGFWPLCRSFSGNVDPWHPLLEADLGTAPLPPE